MFKYIIKRIVSLIPVALIISVLLFGLSKAMPGDPIKALIPQDIKDPAEIQAIYEKIRAEYGYDKPIPVQYVRWGGRLLKGDLGMSTTYKRPVSLVIKEPLKNSVVLNLFSITLSFLIAIPVGIKSAVKRGSKFDNFWQVTTLIGLSVPTFFISMILIFTFAIKLKLLPIGSMPSKGNGGIGYYLTYGRHLILPVATLTFGSLASTTRYVRNAMIDVLNQDYIRTARSKGLSSKVVIYRHAFRNALIPIVTLVAGSLVGVFGGSMITESIFAWNGIGYILQQAIVNKDYNIVLAMNMFYAVIALLANLLMDLGYALVDPRVKLD